MIRWSLAAVSLVAWGFWALAGGALALGGLAPTARRWGDLAATATVAAHLTAAGWLRLTRLPPRPEVDPEWAEVQAERHRRLGAWFAAWGASAALAWLPARPGDGPVGWPAWGVVAGNLGFQPGLLAAEALAVAARGRLGRALVGAGVGARIG